MAINFTDSPSNGATQVIGGRTYTYNSAKNKWDTTATEVVGPTATNYATVDDLPGTATTGAQAFVTATNRLYIWNGTGWYNIALINTAPSISGVNSSYTLASDGTATTVTITASDPEGLPITYSIASDTSGNIATVTQGTGANTNVFTITPSTSNGGTFSLTFRASDGVNIASSIASFTLEFKIVNSNYTTALITSVGGNNAVNNSFVDSSTNSHTITVGGNAHQTTFSPYRHGGYSTYFDGTGDFLSATHHSSFDLGSDDFTIETWIYLTGYSNSYGGYYASGICGKDNTTTRSYTFSVSGTSNTHTGLYFNMFTGGTPNVTQSTTSFNLNQWYHVAVSRESGTLRMFVDGVVVQTNTSANQTPTAGSQPLVVGAGSSYSSYEYRFPGYLADFRFVKGSAVYTAAFTPPTQRLTAVTNTSLLTCHLPYIADGSTNGHTLTVNGDTHTEPFAPYEYNQYASTNGGSMYFDGTGDYITAPSHTSFDFGTGDFTIETWINIPDVTSDWLAFISRAYSNNGGWRLYKNLGNNNLRFYYTDSGTTSYVEASSTGLTNNTWHHIAIVRNSSTTTIYVDGVSKGSGTISTSLNPGTFAVEIGSGVVQSSYPITGNMADVRIVKGTAVYTSDFTPPTAPLTAITNTSLLLSGTNAGIIDKSQSIQTMTLNGNVSSSTAQTKYLSSSMYFNGNSSNYIAADGIALNSAIFTVEFWMRGSNVSPGSNFRIIEQPSGAFAVDIGSGGKIRAHYNGGNFKTANGAVTVDTWHHVAVVREGTGTDQSKIYIDGTSLATGTLGDDYTDSSFEIGGNSTYYTGYLSDLRITKGLARYTANFTPPSAALDG